MMQPIIKLNNISAGYDGKLALQDVCLEVYPHDFLGIIGPNGGGKTTLVKVLLGLIKPEKGTIAYYHEGKEVSELTMGYLPQYSNIDKDFPISVYEVVQSGLNRQKPFMRHYTREQRQQVADTIKQMELEDLKDCHIGALSGGQLQRVLLARAIVSKPEVLVLDEPNTYIDQYFKEQMYMMLDIINMNCAIVMVSHGHCTIMLHRKSRMSGWRNR
jgi:zinc transport system ATP-binding protein